MGKVDEYFSNEYIKNTYNCISTKYNQERNFFDNRPQLEQLNKLIPPHSKILDVGCGSGIPVIKYFAEREHAVVGNDIPPEMLMLAKENVPKANELINKDMLQLDFEGNYFSLICAFYSLFHVDKNKHEQVFKNFYRMLKQGGYLYFTLAGKSYTGQKEFHGTKFFGDMELPYSHYSIEKYNQILRKIRFNICSIDDLTIGNETLTWVLVQK